MISPVRVALRRGASSATIAAFFIQGFLVSSWIPQISLVQQRLRLNDGALGLALFGAPAGAALALFVSAALIPFFGSRRVLRAALVGYCVSGPFVGLAPSGLSLFVALFIWGGCLGGLDAAMNTQAIAVENSSGAVLMPGFHASWSIGALLGALAGVAGVALRASLTAQLVVLGAPCLVVGAVLSRQLLTDPRVRADPAPRLWRPTKRPAAGLAVPLLGLIVFADMLCEGAAGNWSAVYLRNSLHASAVLAGVGYVTYSVASLSVRLCGNALLRAVRVERMLPALVAVATVGFGGALLLNSDWAMIVGFGLLGAGLGMVVPVVFRAAGRLSDVHAGSAVPRVAAIGWFGIACGPPLLGAIAVRTSLRLALAAVPLLCAAVAVMARSTAALRAASVPSEL